MADTQFVTLALPEPTAAGTVKAPTLPPETAGDLIPVVSNLRYATDLVHAKSVEVQAQSVELGRKAYSLHLAERTATRERQAVKSLLDDIAATGLSWTLMSRIFGVSVPAIRKWRLGEGASPENRHAVARLAALLDLLDDQFMVEDPAAWLEIPLAETHRTVADIFIAGRDGLVLDYASRWIPTPEALLDEFDPAWREAEAAREYETFDAPDGGVGIRRRAGK
jgi:hypothetical protein